ALGVARLGMSRHVDLTDLTVIGEVSRLAADGQADVLHGHGAKGGAYTRLASRGRAIRAYTPHGGSLHYQWLSTVGFFYLAVERALRRRTDLLLFESAYGRDTFRAKIGEPTAIVRVIHNGIMPVEIAPVEPDAQASDLVFVGELRILKGVDLLLDAIALVRR